MTELTLKWKQIFDEIASILENLYVENAELKTRVEALEKVNKEKLTLLKLVEEQQNA